MELPTLLYTALFLVLSTILILLRRKTKLPLPPGPIGLPIVGSLPFLDPSKPTFFIKLSEKYGPIFSLKLGSKLVIVISSPSLVKVLMKDEASTFANRDVPASIRVITYGGNDLAWCPHGPMWRMLRRVLVHEMLSPSSLDSVAYLREREVRSTVRYIYSKSNTPVDIGSIMFMTLMNVVTNTLWGGTLDFDKEKELVGKDFRELVAEIAKLVSNPNLSDLFPILARFDLQGVESRMKACKERFDRIFEGLIEKRNSHDDAKKKDILGYMLTLEKEGGDGKSPFTMNNVKALLMDIVVGGTDTSSSAVEWAMAELLKNPQILKKTQEELDRVVGKENIVQESHLSQLHFLSLVIKETLRLYPVAPISIPRLASSSCTIDKYLVPAGSTVYFNLMALHRDPKIWTDPLAFKPERFLQESGKWDFYGKNFDYIPFGAGTRICAGVTLAERMMGYFLATMVHSFDWKLPEGTKLDMSDKFHIVLRKAVPLLAIPTPRLSKNELYL